MAVSSKQFRITTSDGLKLAAIAELPKSEKPVPLAVLVHGYTSGKNSNSYTALAPRLHEQGIGTVRFDFRGHYDSEGQIEEANITTGLRDLSAIAEWVQANPSVEQTRLGIVGGSYGGVVTTLFAAEHDYFKAVVLKAPATDWAAARRLRMGENEMRKWKEEGQYTFPYSPKEVVTPYSFYEDIASYDTLKVAKNIRCPVLILHGDADESVPVEQSKKLVEAIGDNAELHVFPGADHRFTKEADFERWLSEATEFTARHLLQ